MLDGGGEIMELGLLGGGGGLDEELGVANDVGRLLDLERAENAGHVVVGGHEDLAAV